MSSPLDAQVEAASADFQVRREKLLALEKRMNETSATAHAKNRVVSATVDQTGRLTGLKFEGARLRSMAPKELAAVVLETVQNAQREAANKGRELAREFMPDTFEMFGLDV